MKVINIISLITIGIGLGLIASSFNNDIPKNKQEKYLLIGSILMAIGIITKVAITFIKLG